MAKIFFVLIPLILFGFGSAYAEPFAQVGDIYETETDIKEILEKNPDNTFKIRHEIMPPRIQEGFDLQGKPIFKNYILTETGSQVILETNQAGSLIFNKNSCAFDLFEPGKTINKTAKVNNFSWTLKGKSNSSSTWTNVNSINDAACTVSVVTSPTTVNITGSKTSSVGTFKVELFYLYGHGIKETLKAYNNNPAWTNHNIGFTETLDVPRVIKFGNQTFDLADHNGTTLDRNWLVNHKGQFIKLSDKLFYDFGLGFENLDSVKIYWNGHQAKLSFNYLFGDVIVPYQTWFEVDPTLTITATGFDHSVYNGGTQMRAGERFTAGSVMVGKTVNYYGAWLKKSGNPTGTLYFKVWDSTGTEKKTYGTLDVTTLTGTYTKYMVAYNATNKVVVAGDTFGITYQGGDGSNHVQFEVCAPTCYDGTNADIGYSNSATGALTYDTNNDYHMEFIYDEVFTNPPNAPRDLTATSTGKTTVDLDWGTTDMKGGTLVGYQANRTSSGLGLPQIILINSTTATDYTVTGLTACTSYSFRIATQSTQGYNATGNIANATTACFTPPAAPTLTATAESDTSVRFTAVNGTTGDFNIAWFSLRCEINNTGGWITPVSNSTIPTPRIYIYSGLSVSDTITCQWRDGSAAGWGPYSNNATGMAELDIIEPPRAAGSDRLIRLSEWFDSYGGVYMGMSLFPFIVMLVGFMATPKTTHIFTIITLVLMGILHGSGYFQYPDWYWAIMLLLGMVIVLARR